MTVSELIEHLQMLPGCMEVGGWHYHFLPMNDKNPVSVETVKYDRERTEPDANGEYWEKVTTQVAVLGFQR